MGLLQGWLDIGAMVILSLLCFIWAGRTLLGFCLLTCTFISLISSGSGRTSNEFQPCSKPCPLPAIIMRHFLLLILFPFASQGQDLTKVKKISFRYTIGHYSFGDTGRYEREEITEFVPVSSNSFSRSTFTITKRYVQNSETKENNLSVKDTILSKSDKSFSLSTFHDLLDNLNKTKDNFEKANLLPFLSPISKKEILSVAKKHHNEFWLIDGENGRVDKVGRERIKKIKRLYLLDTFLLMRKPSLEYEMVVMDAWNNLTISFCEQTDTTKYSFQFYELLGQPFSKTINNDYSHRVRFVNSDVNGLLTKILPRNSLTAKAIGFERLKEEYIAWFIGNKIWGK
ncbi:MAG: hypothetical protein IPN43_17160 [Chitinophagaceae bacterium]|nr:hypothetical protein [Chitinophagaceae bacterium]